MVQVLNTAFQAAVLRGVERHRDIGASPASEGDEPLRFGDGTLIVTVECTLGEGEVGSVQVVIFRFLGDSLREFLVPKQKIIWNTEFCFMLHAVVWMVIPCLLDYESSIV